MTKISDDLIATDNTAANPDLSTDYSALGERLSRSGIDIDAITEKVSAFGVAVPSLSLIHI